MPELPEVETIVRQIAPRLAGRRVVGIDIFDPKLNFAPPRGKFRIGRVERVGKEAALELVAPGRPPRWLLFHLRMTGRLIWTDDDTAPGRPPLRARLRLERGALELRDVRRFGTLRLAADPAAGAGLDPLRPAFTARALEKLLAGSPTPVKPWLMRQDRLAGIGNIYASEALFAAGIDPRRPAGSLTREETARLRRALRLVLGRAIRAGGTTISDFRDANGSSGGFARRLAVYGRADGPCPRCGAPIVRIVQQQRSTYFCTTCQR